MCALRCRVFFFVERARGIEATLFSSGAQKRARLFVSKSNRFSSESRLSIFLDIFFPALFFRSINLSFFLSNHFLGEDDDDDARRRRKRQSPLDHTRNNASRNKTLLVRRLLAVFFVSFFFFPSSRTKSEGVINYIQRERKRTNELQRNETGSSSRKRRKRRRRVRHHLHHRLSRFCVVVVRAKVVDARHKVYTHRNPFLCNTKRAYFFPSFFSLSLWRIGSKFRAAFFGRIFSRRRRHS